MPSQIQLFLARYEKEESEWGYRYIMKGYSYFKCINCKKAVRMLTAGLSKEAMDNMVCPCGAKRFESITRSEYDKLTSAKKILTKGGETKFKPPERKTKRRHQRTLTTRLGQDKYVLPVTEGHGGAKTKKEVSEEMEKEKRRDKKPRRRPRGHVVDTTEPGQLVVIEEGLYPGTLEELVDVDTDYGASLRWVFSLEPEDTGEEDVVELSGISSKRFNEKTKAYKWSSALMGRKFDVGESVDLDDNVGMRGMLEVKTGELRDGTEISNVVDVKPMPKKKAPKRKAEEEEEEEEEERPKKKHVKKPAKKPAKKREEEEEEEEEGELEEEFGEEEEGEGRD